MGVQIPQPPIVEEILRQVTGGPIRRPRILLGPPTCPLASRFSRIRIPSSPRLGILGLRIGRLGPGNVPLGGLFIRPQWVPGADYPVLKARKER